MTLLDERLAACANLGSPIESAFRWRGRIEQCPEIPLCLKTRFDLFDQLCARVRSLHPFETPSIIGHEIVHIDSGYRQWVIDETLS